MGLVGLKTPNVNDQFNTDWLWMNSTCTRMYVKTKLRCATSVQREGKSYEWTHVNWCDLIVIGLLPIMDCMQSYDRVPASIFGAPISVHPANSSSSKNTISNPCTSRHGTNFMPILQYGTCPYQLDSASYTSQRHDSHPFLFSQSVEERTWKSTRMVQ